MKILGKLFKSHLRVFFMDTERQLGYALLYEAGVENPGLLEVYDSFSEKYAPQVAVILTKKVADIAGRENRNCVNAALLEGRDPEPGSSRTLSEITEEVESRFKRMLERNRG